jgi:hypothetical protein
MTNKITMLKEQINEQREWGHHKVADLLAAELATIPQSWIDCSIEEESQ